MNALSSVIRFAGFLAATVSVLVLLPAPADAYENLASRSLVARPKDGGTVFLGWRFLLSDAPTTAFDVHRSTSGGPYAMIATVTDSTNYEDGTTSIGTTYAYYVTPVDGGVAGLPSNTVTITARATGSKGEVLDIYGAMPTPYNPAAMTGCPQNMWCRLATGDLNGDGLFDFVISWGCRKEETGGVEGVVPPFPYDTQHLQAYLHDGTFLGWQFESGLSYGYNHDKFMANVPVVLYDLDDDGMAEIITKKSYTPIDYTYTDELQARATIRDYRLVVLDGLTGRIKAETAWPRAMDMPNSGIGLAYLNVSGGDNRPSIIVLEGNHSASVDKLKAYRYTGSALEEVWSDPVVGCKTAHTIQILDFDGDRNDELVLGMNVVDEDGRLLWRYGGYHEHGDLSNVGDIDLGVDGFEAVFGLEQYDTTLRGNAVLVLSLPNVEDSDDVQVLAEVAGIDPWGNVGNIDPAWPGLEIYWSGAGEGGIPRGLIRSDHGTITPLADRFGVGFFLEWDGDDSRQEWLGNPETLPVEVRQYVSGTETTTIDHLWETGGGESLRSYVVADILGDYREEVITRRRGTGDGTAGINILTSTEVIHNRRPTPLHDRYYRHRMTQWAVIYQYNQNNTSCGIGIPEPLKGRNSHHGGNVLAVRDLIASIAEDRQPLSSLANARTNIEMIAAPFEAHRLGGMAEFPLKNRKNPLTMLGK